MWAPGLVVVQGYSDGPKARAASLDPFDSLYNHYTAPGTQPLRRARGDHPQVEQPDDISDFGELQELPEMYK